MTTTRFITISGAIAILYISILIIGGFNPFHWFSTIPLIAICVMLFMKLNNDANRTSLKAFKAEIEEHSEDLKWLQDKKADLNLSNINGSSDKVRGCSPLLSPPTNLKSVHCDKLCSQSIIFAL